MTKKRILFVRPTLGAGGADRVTLNLLKGFDRNKYEISLALMRKEGVLLSQIPEDIDLIDMNKSSLYKVVPSMLSFYKSGDYDVIYSTSSGMSIPLILAKIMSRSKNVLCVVSERSSLERRRLGGIKNRVIFRLKCWLTSKADYVVAVSDSIVLEISRYTKTDSTNIIRAYNPVIAYDYDQLKDETISSNIFNTAAKKLLAIGRLEEVKNFQLLIEAFSDLSDKEVQLFILGQGPLLNNLKNHSNQKEVGNRVHFLGFDNNVYKYLDRADAFALTSNFEGMPGALIQAMACKIPCVSTDCETGPRELIQSGHNGYLIPVGDVKKLTESLDLIFSDTKKAALLAENASKSVENYQFNTGVKSYFNFIEA